MVWFGTKAHIALRATFNVASSSGRTSNDFSTLLAHEQTQNISNKLTCSATTAQNMNPISCTPLFKKLEMGKIIVLGLSTDLFFSDRFRKVPAWRVCLCSPGPRAAPTRRQGGVRTQRRDLASRAETERERESPQRRTLRHKETAHVRGCRLMLLHSSGRHFLSAWPWPCRADCSHKGNENWLCHPGRRQHMHMCNLHRLYVEAINYRLFLCRQ